MSGGIAYVLNVKGNFDYFCNKGMVELSPVGDHDDLLELQKLINNHYSIHRSELAESILVNWEEYLPKFVKVIPLEYKKVLEEQEDEPADREDPEDRGRTSFSLLIF